ncbi:hypothetical protein PIB30_050124 [Stylosanthes scabra]|uniref:Uncharacterized protein n=1 Tax=Stylosanthes scabra TaxID=79078 RepID=A0ABU6THA6_9FABA|nr:hypothetical protein [Stylosanthes scabra]
MTRDKHKTHTGSGSYTSLLSHRDKSMQGRYPKLRIKVPKLSLFLAKKMHWNKRHFHIKENANAASDRGSNNNMGFSSSNEGKKNNEDNGDNAETERELSRELENNLVCGDDNDELLSVGVVSLSQLIALEEHEGGKADGKKNKMDKKLVRMNHRLVSFLDEKKRRWRNFIIKAKSRKNKFSGDDGDCDCAVKRYRRPARRRRKVSLWRLIRIPSRMLIIRALKLKMVKSLATKKKVRKQSEQGKGDDGEAEGVLEVELCKRRILMGAKCKPLSSSGVLRHPVDEMVRSSCIKSSRHAVQR